ncbi:hypothetical protein [Bradyrhizobium iriomotense]|uniref:hypothetical protein n=1 Tax=Bradyrhizobium iriomotense TaxID=441950 RepID=UPI001B8A0414|nr:hypothetical protein [Bradyrhizobium iriomotense]MBR0781073.1 hypothetical protein [Bradyrhizobium iriomotense]
MRRRSLIVLASIALALAAGSLGRSSAASQQVRDTVRSEYFTARVLKVERDTDRSRSVTVEFVAGPLSQVEAVSIRLNEGHCTHPARVTDALGNGFISAHCGGGVPYSGEGDFWLDEPGRALVRRYRFVGAASGGDGPYDVVIPVLYSLSGEEDRKAPQTAQALSFFGVK